MGLISEFRARARHIVGPAIGLVVIGYFVYHAINGDRGIIAYQSFKQQVKVSKLELARVAAERQTLENRVRLLHPESLDPDMLDEWSRRMLNYGLPDEVIILTTPPATGQR